MWFDTWSDVQSVLISGLFGYAGIIVWLRIGGKRSLAKWNSFDLVVTVALGSVFASLLLLESVSILEGLAGFALLIAMQMSVTWASSRFSWADHLFKARPVLLFRDGDFIDSALKSERVAPSEVLAAMRAASFSSFDDVHAVVLETDGTFSVFDASAGDRRSTLQDVQGYRLM